MAADWLTAAKSALVVSKFHCFYLAQNLLSTKKVADMSETRSPTFLVSDLSATVGDLLKTCRRPGFKQVLSKIDVMEFGN